MEWPAYPLGHRVVASVLDLSLLFSMVIAMLVLAVSECA